MPDLQALLERIEWLDAELKKPVPHDQISFAERLEREDELAHLGMTSLPQLAKALRAVTKECDRLKAVSRNTAHPDSPSSVIIRATAVRQTADSVLEVLHEAMEGQ